MRVPKLHVLLLIAVGFLLLGSVSIPPNMGRKPVLSRDGTVAHRPDGSVVTETDDWGYVKKNWFGHLSFVLSAVFFILAVGRLLWIGWIRLLRPHKTLS